jgi:long-chain fatty acid transport protein
MTRLPGTQLLVGAQALYGDLQLSPGAGTSPALGSGDGGNPVGWLPGGGLFLTHALGPTIALGLAVAGNFGLAEEYEAGWVGRYYVEESTLLGISVLPSVAWAATDTVSVGASLNAMYGVLKTGMAINSITAPDGKLSLEDQAWGVGVNVGVHYQPAPGTRLGLVYTSPVDLGFEAKPEFSGLTPALEALLASQGLLDATVSLGIEVPQGVMVSAFQQLDDRWALLCSAGWQQWSSFGKVEVGIDDTSNPTSLTHDLDYEDTWHLALGAQVRPSGAWRIDLGVGYDSGFQGSEVTPVLPANSAWRFGAGVRHQASEKVAWGLAGAYVYGGTLTVDEQSSLPVATGGRGNLSGSYENAGIFFLAASLDWRP